MEQIPSWARAQDMRGLLDEIDKQEFTALSPGIGLGKARRPNGRQKPDTPTRANAATSGYQPVQMPVATPVKRGPRAAESQKVSPPKARTHAPKAFGIGRRLQAYFLDFLLVIATCAVALVGFTAYGLRGSSGGKWLEQPAVQWLATTSPLITLALIYAVFLAYGLLFKLVVGSTCGESLLGISAKSAEPAISAKQKNL